MNIDEINQLKKELKRHVLECENILSLLDNVTLTKEQILTIKKIADLIKFKNSRVTKDEEKKFIELIDSIPSVAIQGYNKDREVVYWNKSSETIYGYSSSEALGNKLEELIIPTEMREAAIAGIQDWYENDNAIPASELVLQRKDKTTAHVFSSHVMLGAGSPNPEMFCVDIDLSEIASLKVENKHLEEKANKDKLTNTYNRHYFDSIIEQKIQQSKYLNRPLSLIMFDIDFFKTINDSHGHNIGDKALIKQAAITKEVIRKDDILVRWGGEEFMLLIETDLRHAIQIAHKLRKNIEEITNKMKAIPAFTCSFGVVDILNYDSFQNAYESVDTKLLLAKKNGRNRVES